MDVTSSAWWLAGDLKSSTNKGWAFSGCPLGIAKTETRKVSMSQKAKHKPNAAVFVWTLWFGA